MTLNDALEITKEYQNIGALLPDEEFMLIEALTFLIDYYGETFDGSVYMFNLGTHYLRRGEYSLAEKYLQRSASCDNEYACQPLGLIWYYGLNGSVDYEKAFDCFLKSEETPLSKVMLGEMYKEGHFVEKDKKKYREYIFSAMDQVWDSPVSMCKGEVFCKYAEIVLEEEKDGNRMEELSVLLIEAESHQQNQLLYYASSRDIDIMKRIKLLQQRIFPEVELLTVFDLYWALKNPAAVEFDSPEEHHIVYSVAGDSSMEICLDGKWFRDIDHFFREALVEDFIIYEISYELTDFRFTEVPL